jgi:2-polyprenylphenol hydroxylase and related flavodoxin oxidoreductases
VSHQDLFLTFTVSENRKENYRARTLVLDALLPAAQPGQFIMAWLPSIGEKPFSVAAADPLTLTIAAVGPVSEALCRLPIGARLWVRGPFGQGFKLEGKKLLLAGGGYGAAPLRFLAQEGLRVGAKVCVCLGAKTADDLLLAEAFRSLGCTVWTATEDDSAGLKGLVTGAVEAALRDFRADGLYACGPKPMLLALVELCRKTSSPGNSRGRRCCAAGWACAETANWTRKPARLPGFPPAG